MDVDELDDQFEPGNRSPTTLKKQKRKRTSRACSNCARAHLSCCERRPCDRCVSSGKGDSCKDGRRKRRGRKRKSGGDDDDDEDSDAMEEESVGSFPQVNRLSVSPGSAFASSAEMSDEESSPRTSPKYPARRNGAISSSLPTGGMAIPFSGHHHPPPQFPHSPVYSSSFNTNGFPPAITVTASSSWQGSSGFDAAAAHHHNHHRSVPTVGRAHHPSPASISDNMFDMEDDDKAASQLLKFKSFSHSLPSSPVQQGPLHAGNRSHTAMLQQQHQPMSFGFGSPAQANGFVQPNAPFGSRPLAVPQNGFGQPHAPQTSWSAPDNFSAVPFSSTPVGATSGSLL